MTYQQPKKGVCRGKQSMDGVTVIAGSEVELLIHRDVFVRHQG